MKTRMDATDGLTNPASNRANVAVATISNTVRLADAALPMAQPSTI